MKKIVAFLLVLSLMFALYACGGSTTAATPTAEPTAEPTPEPTEEPVEETINRITEGETIATDKYEITLVDVQIGDSFVNPSNGSLSHYSGKTNISATVIIKNVSKNEIPAKQAVALTADYKDGYLYNAKERDFRTAQGIDYWPVYDNFNIIKMPALSTYSISGKIEVPSEVWENTEAPLLLRITLWGETEYVFTFTENEYNPPYPDPWWKK